MVHGSMARGDITALSDVDLVVVAEPGQRAAIWEERDELTCRLLGTHPVTAWDVPHQRPYRWQARTAELDMLDLTLDEGKVDVWTGLAGDAEFLVDRGGVRAEFERAVANLSAPGYDVEGECDFTWGLFAWLAGGLLHHRTYMVRSGVGDLIGRRLLPLLTQPAYWIGSVGDRLDEETVARLDEVTPRTGQPEELGRALQAAGRWYAELLTAWAVRAGRPRPASGLEPGTTAALARWARGELA